MIDLGEDTGYAVVKLGGVEKRIDLWMLSNKFSEITEAHKGKSAVEWLQAVADALAAEGFPEMSHFAARELMSAVWKRAGELKNSDAGETRPGSPASTESTPTA